MSSKTTTTMILLNAHEKNGLLTSKPKGEQMFRPGLIFYTTSRVDNAINLNLQF